MSDFATEFNIEYQARSALRQRQDDDLRIRYYLQKYLLCDTKGKPLENASHITLNDARIFGDACMYVLGEDKPTWEITGVDPSIQSKLEEWIKLALYQNDLILSDDGIDGLMPAINFFDLFRGAIAGLFIVEKDKGKYSPRAIPVDSRWVTFKRGPRGFDWFSYRTRMPSGKASEKFNITTYDKNVEIETVWKKDTIEKYMGSQNGIGELLEPPNNHNLGFVPAVFEYVPTQPMVLSSGGDYDTDLSKMGESIYASVRDMIDYMNEWASVMATMNKMQFLAPMVLTGQRKELAESPYGWGKVTFLDKDETLKPMYEKEVSPAMQTLFRELFSRFEIATMTRMGLGGNPPIETSALLGAQLRSDRDKIFGVRRKAKTTFFRKGINCWRKQIKGKCYNTDVDEDDSVETDLKLFEKKFQVNVSFSSVSPEENITNLQTAAQAKNLEIPTTTIYRDFLHIDDPEGMNRARYIDTAEKMIPALMLFNAKIALDSGTASEEEINKARAVIINDYIKKQAQTGEVQPVPNQASQPKTNIPVTESSQEKSKQMAKNTGNTVEVKGLRR